MFSFKVTATEKFMSIRTVEKGKKTRFTSLLYSQLGVTECIDRYKQHPFTFYC